VDFLEPIGMGEPAAQMATGEFLSLLQMSINVRQGPSGSVQINKDEAFLN
jgi:hypothetical protein